MPGESGHVTSAPGGRAQEGGGSRANPRFPRCSVTQVTHPLVRHKLGLLRDVETDTEMFRRLVNELTLLLTYEGTKDLALETINVQPPLEMAAAERIPGKKIAACPILRAGMGML